MNSVRQRLRYQWVVMAICTIFTMHVSGRELTNNGYSNEKPLRAQLPTNRLSNVQLSGIQLSNIQLRHRTAEQIIPIIKPMLNDSTKLSGQAFQLFVHGTGKDIDMAKQLIAQLDVAPKSYQIYVRVASESSENQSDAQLDASVSNRDVQIKGKILSTNRSDTDGLQQSVRATEGYPVYLNTGDFVPTAFRVYGTSGTQFTPVISGFYLIPLARGNDRLLLKISQQRQKLQNRSIEQQSLSTQLILPLNEWTEIGRSKQFINQQSKQQLTTRATQQQQTVIEIKAIQLP